MKHRIIPVLVVLTALLTTGYFIDRYRAQKQSLLSGYFESQPTQASSRLGGRVQDILVKEGDLVKAGQPLVRLEADSYEATVEAQRQQQEQARQQYLETLRGPREEQIARQEAVVREAQATYEKLRRGPLPEEIRSARNRLAQAQAQYRKLRSGSRPEEIAAAQAAANVALGRLRQAQRGLTQEERSQLRARVEAAKADEEYARKQLERARYLLQEGAISRQQLDAAVSAHTQAAARLQDAQKALERAQAGTPPEELSQAREAYRQAAAQLALVRNGSRREDVESARQEVGIAQEGLNLLLRGSRVEDLEAASARVAQAKAALTELKHGNRSEDIARASAANKQAQKQTESAEKTLAERTVYSTVNGFIDRIMVADGDLVNAGSAVVQLSDPADIWLRVYIPEAQLSKVKVRDSADLAVDGIEGIIPGYVESIATKGEFTPANLQSPEERGKQVFAIRIRLRQPDPRVKAGMYTTVKKVGQWP